MDNFYFILKEGKGLAKIDDHNCKASFEGEYSNGEINGKAKEYYYDKGNLKFEGEYLNGLRNGKGKEYFNGKLIFDGEYKNGIKNGKGK